MFFHDQLLGPLSKTFNRHYELFGSFREKEKLHGATPDQEEEGVSFVYVILVYSFTYLCADVKEMLKVSFMLYRDL